MEEQETNQNKSKESWSISNPQIVLAGAILLAAVIISGALIYTKSQSGSNNIAQVGAGAGQPTAPVAIKVGADDHILGNPNAKVTIVEFADFRCPFCERFFQQTEKPLISNYINSGKVRFVFKNYAFLGQQSVWASEASECAAEQGKFWQYHDWLYNNQAPESNLDYYSKNNLTKYAGTVGLNTAQFASCLNGGKYSQKVSGSLAEGQAAGVTGTPTIFVNGKIIVGAQPYETFKAAVDAALK